MQQKVKRYKERIYELESELEKKAATIATLEEKVLTALSLAAWFPDVSLSQSKFARKGISFLWSLAFRQLSLAFHVRLCSRPNCKT